MDDPAALERGLHERLGLWAADHARRYSEITVLGYDPASRPEQRIETFKSPAGTVLAALDDADRFALLQAGYERTLGTGAGDVLGALAECADDLRDALAGGRSVAVLTGHADTLYDVGAFGGGVALALGDPALIGRNATILNKVMSRELFSGTPIADLFREFGSVYWVIPDSDSARTWGIDERAIRYINANAMRTLLRDMREGIVLTLAPTGSAMRPEYGPDGQLVRIVVPPVADGTAKLICHFDAYIVGTLWLGRSRVDGIREIPPRSGAGHREREEADRRLVEEAMETMAAMTQELAGVPVSYAGSAGIAAQAD
jgi:hypothetical protein